MVPCKQIWPLKKQYVPALIFLAVALVSVAMASSAYHAAEDAARIKFDATADDAVARIESNVDLHMALLRATHAFVAARKDNVSASDFKTFFVTLDVDRNFPGLRGLGLLGLAENGQEAALEQAIRDGHDRAIDLFPPSDEPLRAPILLYEPLDHATKAGIGYDMYSDPLRRDAIVAALDTGEPRATGQVMLGQAVNVEPTPGFLVFESLADLGPGQRDVAATNAGLVYATFRTRELFSAALDRYPKLPVHVEAFDGAPEAGVPLFQSAEPASKAFDEDFVTSRNILVAGRPWTVRFSPTAAFVEPASRVLPLLLGVLCLLLGGAIAVAARYQLRAYDAVASLNATVEKSLVEKDLMLQEMKHRIKNSIARVLAIARQTAASAPDIAQFSSSFSARMQAMAASQDMLTRSHWGKAELGELLRIELGQVFGKDLPEGALSGPQVLLSERITQALGLTLHELATNALKYGEASTRPDALGVTWTVVGAGRAKRLELKWSERTTKPVEPPTRLGFGTRLIDMNITRELGGEIERSYGPTGLDIKISIPLGTPKRV